MATVKTTGIKWAIAIIALLVIALISVVVYAICTKQIQYIEKATDVIENPETVEQSARLILPMAKMII